MMMNIVPDALSAPQSSSLSHREIRAGVGVSPSSPLVRSAVPPTPKPTSRTSRRLPLAMRGLILTGFAGLCALAPTSAFAQNSVTAQMTVSLDIVDGCLVNGSPNPNTSMNFGTIQNAQAQTQPLLASTDLTVECNVSSTAGAVSISGGQNSAGGVRRMAVGAQGPTIAYRLYADAARTDEYLINDKNGTFTVTAGTPTTVTIYGRVDVAELNKPSGPYTDLLNVEVSF